MVPVNGKIVDTGGVYAGLMYECGYAYDSFFAQSKNYNDNYKAPMEFINSIL